MIFPKSGLPIHFSVLFTQLLQKHLTTVNQIPNLSLHCKNPVGDVVCIFQCQIVWISVTYSWKFQYNLAKGHSDLSPLCGPGPPRPVHNTDTAPDWTEIRALTLTFTPLFFSGCVYVLCSLNVLIHAISYYSKYSLKICKRQHWGMSKWQKKYMYSIFIVVFGFHQYWSVFLDTSVKKNLKLCFLQNVFAYFINTDQFQ